MDKNQIIIIVSLLRWCIILTILAIFLMIFSSYEYIENDNAGSQQLYCAVIDYSNKQYDDLTIMTPIQLYGKELFDKNCISCHSSSDEMVVGPGLKGITQRRSEEWILKWVQNPQKVLASGDKYANDLYLKFNKASMTPFPSLSKEDIGAILAYIERK
ncbi:c-type cytochrome [Runella salmonicolor]|uniref:Cytochrome c n=1 Tax=Runella salmonicolor TaxID=2950278 RepID=A0ABT1FTM8_9BACT|nr:cytochrome c [Runella salmonicolor]MCP1385122.1 cytochrome c [Runella salmonicolor]